MKIIPKETTHVGKAIDIPNVAIVRIAFVELPVRSYRYPCTCGGCLKTQFGDQPCWLIMQVGVPAVGERNGHAFVLTGLHSFRSCCVVLPVV